MYMSAAAQFLWKSRCISAKKNQFARAAVAQLAQPAGKLLRGLRIAAGIEQNHRCSVQLQLFEVRRTRVFQFRYVYFGEMSNPLQIVFQQCPAFRTPRLPQHD